MGLGDSRECGISSRREPDRQLALCILVGVGFWGGLGVHLCARAAIALIRKSPPCTTVLSRRAITHALTGLPATMMTRGGTAAMQGAGTVSPSTRPMDVATTLWRLTTAARSVGDIP